MAKKRRAVDKREDSIKKKLTAAVMMLLVSCIMVVTSTYAWFTLSTAPEVTGIQTTIGGNGNLEIALADNNTWISQNVLSTSGALTNGEDINTFWGNLVDLSGKNGKDYGLSNISLYPSALNLDGEKVNKAAMLKIPTYGSDGRVNNLSANTVAGVYDNGKFLTTGYGVRAIGTSSSMSARQLAYRTNLVTLGNNISKVISAVKGSLNERDGGTLAGIAITHGTATDGKDTYSVEDVKAVQRLNAQLVVATEQIKASIISAISGYVSSAAAQNAGVNDDAYNYFVNNTLKDINLSTIGSKITITIPGGEEGQDQTYSYDLPSTLTTIISKYNDINTKVTASNSAAQGLDTTNTSATFAWSDISGAMTNLLSTSGVQICGLTVSEIKSNTSALLNKYQEYGGLVVTLGEGSGVYYDIATLSGKFESSIVIPHVEASGLAMDNVKATISSPNISNPLLTVELAAVTAAGAPTNATSTQDQTISDYYGYVLDLFLRTNAEGSNLLLSKAQQRIYSDSENSETMGNGSNMTFTSTDVSFGITQMKELMKGIRIIFMDEEGKIIQRAGLAFIDDDPNTDEDETSYTVIGNEVTADIRIFADETCTTFAETNKIMGLSKNTAQRLSVLVYLDGENVENGDVSIAASSMTGSMNLQFASDATLNPMDYTDLHQ